jgi:hypothetical protein
MVKFQCTKCGYIAVVGWFWYMVNCNDLEEKMGPYGNYRTYWWPFTCCERWMKRVLC